jgi:predicted MPP superfamily phosphohydrolase
MTSRSEKNKKYVDEINKEKTLHITKIVLKILFVIIVILALIFLYGKFYEPKKLKTNEFIIRDNNIPSEFNGIKILHFTDLLYGSNQNSLDKVSEEIKLINPDIIIFTGNIISEDYQVNEDEIKILTDFFNNMPYTIGKYVVNGDKDNQNYHLIMENTDFIILNNEIVPIFSGNNKINLIGINHDTVKEIKNDSEDYTITMINNYDEFSKYNLKSNLILAGHNLGGEIRIFDLPLLGLDKHLNNYYEENSSKIYISSGLGSIHNIRIMNKPSMNVYRLYNN